MINGKAILIVDLDTGKDTLVCENCLEEFDVVIEMVDPEKYKSEKCERCGQEFSGGRRVDGQHGSESP